MTNTRFADSRQYLIPIKLSEIGDLKVTVHKFLVDYASHRADLKTIARPRRVAVLLKGSVQKSGNEVLTNVQVIDPSANQRLPGDAYHLNGFCF